MRYDSVELGRMRTEVTKKLFTVDDFYRMGDAGIFGPEERVELIEGEIILMSPIGDRHQECVDRANELFVLAFHGRARVRIQGPTRLSNISEPLPDLLLLKPRSDYYGSGHPKPGDVFLVIEVAMTTLRFDMRVKLPMYAKYEIPEVWIEDLPHNSLQIYRNPIAGKYTSNATLHRGDSISPSAFPETVFKINDLLG